MFCNSIFNKNIPLVIAAATINVPASILSGIIPCSVPVKTSTPSIRIVSVPAPIIFAPCDFKKLAKSTISGSRATFSMTVVIY